MSLLARARAGLSDASLLRSWTVDANDGIIATAGLLEGFAGAGASGATLVTAAAAATVAGALSLGGTKWAEEAAEREAQLRLIAEERAQLEQNPDDEIAELTAYYVGKGLTPEVARQVAEQLSARDALAAQLESEHGIVEVMRFSATIWAGVTSGVAFAIGAVIPLLITIFVPGALETWAIVAAVIVSLSLTSIVGSRSGVPFVRLLIRSLAVGVGTMGVSFLVGLLLF